MLFTIGGIETSPWASHLPGKHKFHGPYLHESLSVTKRPCAYLCICNIFFFFPKRVATTVRASNPTTLGSALSSLELELSVLSDPRCSTQIFKAAHDRSPVQIPLNREGKLPVYLTEKYRVQMVSGIAEPGAQQCHQTPMSFHPSVLWCSILCCFSGNFSPDGARLPLAIPSSSLPVL